ncbi:Thiosulfate sulfurtransferase, rhodanese [Rhodopirellula islandica]|uniref:Thiosulfate sulfurtransferase, rhodanese n=1 Tax=Rhodopirellula islandica TaxID=595434 RepID=A0A0J1BK19_RHOIS|nr:thioredoxin family protein [Rhodopirellula islandica]KLU06862.1 Thiosulfate sulfurtransferase, rhodanese [Rhodopirellula islandica]
MNHLFSTRIGLLFCIAIIGLGSGCSMSEITGSHSEESFDQLIGQDKLILVKFGSSSCGPCNRLDEELAAIEADPPAGFEIHALSINANRDLARKFDITGIPRMILFRSGQKLGDQVGYQTEEQIRSWISSQNVIVGDVHSNPFAAKSASEIDSTPHNS